MIDVAIAVTPLGTDSTSISDYVAESEKVLNKYPNISHKMNGMDTEIEFNDINQAFDVLKEMHLAQIQKGAQRVTTNIRIDDRRDRNNTLNDKVSSVESKM